MKDTDSLPQQVAGRYRVERLLGVGGMSRVLAVTDERDGRSLALKQLLRSSQATRQARTLAQFRQEFHVLTQIAHPNVIVVDEYGFDADQPYYTMELVLGRPLDQLTPLQWRPLCSTLLDLCAPLSLLHARRFVHSDITARNVLVSDQGVTKLIDFGALTAIDEPTTTVAGTPPYMAPELVNRLLLDARVDIYAIGALAYFALSGRHAYPARTIRELESVWSTPPRALSELGVDVPAALDHLVMSMLSLEPGARPMQMAEVVQRLCAITGDSERDSSAVSTHAATPKLVARERLLEGFRSALGRAAQGHGELICIAAEKGMGRTRALDACALEARLAGSLVLRGADQTRGVELALYASLLQAALQQAPELGVELSETAQLDKPDAEQELLRVLTSDQAPARLDAFWDRLAERRTLVLLVDDLARADLPSVQRILLLAETAKRRRMLIVACVGNGDSTLERNLKHVLGMGRVFKLRRLSASDTQQLLGSMFGEMRQLDALAEWVHAAAAGVPAACVELAHYALERGVIRHHAGQFELASDLARLELPRRYDDAIAVCIRGLAPQAREALGALSLVTEHGSLSAAEHLELLGFAGWPRDEILAALDALGDAQLLKQRADGYALQSNAIVRIAQAELGAEGARRWHERLGTFYQRRGHARSMLAALHLEYAAERERAYVQLLGVDANVHGPDDPNIPLGGSALGIALHQSMRDHAVAKHNRVETLHFRRILLELGATSDPRLGSDGLELLQALRRDAGLDLWDQVDPTFSEHQKLLFCLARGQERYLETPPESRGVPVRDAVRLLAQSASVLASICSLTFDRIKVCAVVPLFEPLRTLTPVLAITYRQLENSRLGLTQGGSMTARCAAILSELATPPEGMRELIWRYLVSNYQCHLGREAAALGDEGYRVYADALAQFRRRRHQALLLQLLFALAYGRFEDSKRLRRELEIAVMSSAHEDQLLAFARIAEIELLEASGDLLELKRLVGWLEGRAQRFAGWQPFAAIARAACLLLCDQPAAAESVLAQQLEAAPVLEHAAWYALRALRAEAILLGGDAALAQQLAEQLLQQAREAQVDMLPNLRVQRVWALATAALGDSEAAVAGLEPHLRANDAAKTIRAGQLHETRARIALHAGDAATFAESLARVRGIYAAGGHPGLLAKLERLQVAGRRAFEPKLDPARATAIGAHSERQTWQHERVLAELERLHGQDRAMYLLSLLIADSRASAGKLYRVGNDGAVTLINLIATPAAHGSLDESVTEYVAHLSALDDELTRCETAEAVTSSVTTGSVSYEAVPLRDPQGALRGVVLLHSEVSGAKLVCAPALCSLVAEALETLDVSALQ